MKTIKSTAIFTFIGLWILTAHGYAADVDHSLYASLLDRHVDKGVVDYKGLQKDEADLDRYLEMLAGVDPDALSKDARFAFYVNAYNAWTIKLILSRYPDISSIKDLGSLPSSPWKKKIASIDGEVLTLDQVEHEILRRQFNNPRFNRLEGDTLWVSKIFDWFGKDSNQDIVGTFIRYAEPQLKAKLENIRDRIKIRHLDYDWSLNGT